MPQPSEIVLISFPFTDLSASKRRPVLVLSDTNAQRDFLAAQITSQIQHRPAANLIDEDFELGELPKESIVRRVGKLTTTAFERIFRTICRQIDCLPG